jgi:hypothetical protein
MEPRGGNRWQPVANPKRPKKARTGENGCRGLRPQRGFVARARYDPVATSSNRAATSLGTAKLTQRPPPALREKPRERRGRRRRRHRRALGEERCERRRSRGRTCRRPPLGNYLEPTRVVEANADRSVRPCRIEVAREDARAVQAVRVLGRGERPRADDDERRRDRIHRRLEVTAPPAVMRCDQHIRAEVAATLDEATPPWLLDITRNKDAASRMPDAHHVAPVSL